MKFKSNLGAVSSSSDFTSIASGISSLIAPLAQAGINVYLTEQQISAQKQLAQAQIQAQAQAQAAAIAAAAANASQPVNSNILIIGGVALIFVVLLILMMSGKNSATPGGSGSYIVKKIIRKTPTS